MNRLISLAAVASLVAAATPAFASETAATPQRQMTPQRVVMMCATDVATERAFRRDHGARPVFITADQALAARATGAGWTTPRCMTEREHRRLTQAMSARTSI